ncbi:beta-adaptin-like protein A [Castanea sativa]|uniref:beta-adaptin-like protein A n=1 Tax=Castanea sativa TaxID=21020 RepID=UPI003F65048F
MADVHQQVYERIKAPLLTLVSSGSPEQSYAVDDLLGLGRPEIPSPAPAPSPPLLKLNSKVVLDPGTFQQKWRQLPISLSQV